MLALIVAHAVAALVAAALARPLGRWAFAVAGLAPLATFVWACTRAGAILDGEPFTESVAWVPSLQLTFDVRVDAFSLLMVLLVSGIGTLVFAYAISYFDHHDGDRAALARFIGALTLFAGSMLGIVTADHVIALFVFWELTSVTSYVLIGYEDRHGSARASALQALLTTGLGGLALLGGLVVVAQEAGTWRLSAILADPPGGAAVVFGLVLVLLGAFTKSAQAPFHAWLPRAMAAPTPVSAYLHSATMVKAGVFLIARFSPAFAPDQRWWAPVVVTVGLVTMVIGGLRALRQYDLKLVLAMGTIGQLGFLVALFGAGTPEATVAGVALLLAHALFKASLFLVVGIVDHATHTRDLRRFSGLGRRLPLLAAVSVLAAASMAGLPPLFGFVAKEKALEAFTGSGTGGGLAVLVVVVVASMLTLAYSHRFAWGAFATKRGADVPVHPVTQVHPPGVAFWTPAALLSVAGLVLGVAPVLVSDLVTRGGAALAPGLKAKELALWHGFTPALAASAVAVAGGAVVVWRRRAVSRTLTDGTLVPGAQQGYEYALAGLGRTARRTASIAQPGSLPLYLGVILLVAVAVPAVAFARLGVPDGLVLADSPLQFVTLAVVSAAAFATTVVRRRFAAVVLLGAVGYGVAVLFVVQGAPDLALTQLLVETLSVVIFVLVLRHLPESFAPPVTRRANATKATVAAVVGGVIAAFLVVAGASRTATPPTEQFMQEAPTAGGGANVVNVILVDVRGTDTLGEITVLTVTALGVIGLLAAARPARRRRAGRRAGSIPPSGPGPARHDAEVPA